LSGAIAPVITIDGPTASGKGTVAKAVAEQLGFHYLDSGALYRITALAALRYGVDLTDRGALAELARGLGIDFSAGRVRLGEEDVSQAIRQEEVGKAASTVAVYPEVRAGLIARQLAFRTPPGLVADGRDMGTVIFPDAQLKVFLVATAEARAERRSKQLMENGNFANITTLLQDLRERDRRDSERVTSPLVAARDAVVIDSSDTSAAEVVERIMALARERGMGL
jgi:cytidylate kinase